MLRCFCCQFLFSAFLLFSMGAGVVRAQSVEPSGPTAPAEATQPAQIQAVPPSADSALANGAATPMSSDTQSGPVEALTGPASLLPQDLSPWGMFKNAGPVVKAVICLLAFAVLLTWTIWLAKMLELSLAKHRLLHGMQHLRRARTLSQAVEHLGPGHDVTRALLTAACDEWSHSADALTDRDGLKERIALSLERVEAAAGRRMNIGTGVLASIGSTAPFVGLFGTVWGIMNSFVGISRLHTTNLAVVAPGIAEALLATACGLVAAIPAVVIYNHFARQIGAYKAQLADAGVAIMRICSRDLSRGIGSDGNPVGRNLRMVAE